MPFSATYAQQILNYTLGKVKTLTAPTYVYIGLCTNDPDADNGTFNELSGGGYARVMISQTGETYPALIGIASGRKISSVAQINWNKATSDWARVNGFGLFSAAAGGSPFFYGKLDLTEEQKAAGGLLVVKDAVALFEAGQFGLEFLATDYEEPVTE